MRFDLEKLEFVECEIDKDKLAISGSDKDLTWGEFKKEVETLKEEILSYNLPQGHPIIIYGHKEAKFIISIVACMSLKMPYIPIDNVFPQDRVDKIQSIVQSSLIIDCLLDAINSKIKNSKVSYLIKNDPIIYIMFTSGSTGEPKGVQITHSSIIDYTTWIKKDFPFSNEDIFFNQIPFSFDLSTYELFGFLMYGASIVTFSRNTISKSDKFILKLKQYKCTVWNSTPSFLLLSLMINELNTNNLPSLLKVFLAGEQMTHKVAKKLFMSFPNINLFNTYGPTEVTNTSTFVNITQDILNKYNLIPVGFPKYSTKINLLNKELENGKNIGEIQLIGDNVSIGYFKNEKLNSEKFSIVDDKKAFKTGDYGYFEDDMLFFANRKDDLIKLHGFRIETMEIDTSLLNIDNINNAITISLKRGSEVIKLITFIIADTKINIKEIKDSISKLLPYYMIPSDIIQIDKLPYNANHKIDKKELINIYRKL
jgi:D-alanine--poly(phosphoribitol) ligase subunit 1